MPPKKLHKHRLAIKKSVIEAESIQKAVDNINIDISGKGHQKWSDEFLPAGILPEYVKGIFAAKNEFTSIDISFITKYIALEKINFSRNLISSLDNFQWSSIQTIRELDISRNQLTALPIGLAELQRLEVLNVHHNHLTALPDNISEMKSLRSLDASYNIIQSVDLLLEDLPLLDHLDLVHNSESIERGMGPRTSRLYRKVRTPLASLIAILSSNMNTELCTFCASSRLTTNY